MLAERFHELRHPRVPLDASEFRVRFVRDGADPSEDHLTSSPPLHVPTDGPKGAVEVLDRVGRREGPLQGLGQAQPSRPLPRNSRRGTRAPQRRSSRAWMRPSPSRPSGPDIVARVPGPRRWAETDPPPHLVREEGSEWSRRGWLWHLRWERCLGSTPRWSGR